MRRAWMIPVVAAALLPAPAAHAAPGLGTSLPLVSVAPFAGLLLAIALLPLFAGHFWESNARKAVVAAAFALPVAAWLLLVPLRASPVGVVAGVTAPVVAVGIEAIRLQRRP